MAFQPNAIFNPQIGFTGQQNAFGGQMFMNPMLDPDVKAQTEASKYNAGLQANAAMFPARLQQERFNQVFPWLQGQIGGILNSGPFTAGGQSGAGPEITASQVLSPQQIQQQVNNMRANVNQGVASQQRQAGNALAGRGLGTNSPLAMALNQGFANQGMASQVSGANQLRLGAAQQNAQQLLQSQVAREQQFANRENAQIERTKPYFQTINSLFGSLAGLV